MTYNPIVTISSDIEIPAAPMWSRKTYTRVNYSSLTSFIYDGSTSNLSLSNVGGSMYLDTLFFQSMFDFAEPPFMSTYEWQGSASSLSSVVLTPQKSIMPRPLVPSQFLIGNEMNGPASTAVFNWELEEGGTANSRPTSSDEASCVSIGQNGVNGINKLSLSQGNVSAPKLDGVDSNNLITRGAFQIAFRILDSDSDGVGIQSQAGPNPNVAADGGSKANSKVTITVGDLVLIVNGTGECLASCGGGSYSISLKRSLTEQVMPQAKSPVGPDVVISVIPCWNGVIVQSGIQDGDELSSKSGAFVPLHSGEGLFAHAKKYNISTGGGGILTKNIQTFFDIRNPEPIEIDNNGVHVSLAGDGIYVSAENCCIVLAYVPLFFPPVSKFLHAIRGNLPVSQYVYNYSLYPIWTQNDSNANLSYDEKFQQTGFGAYFGNTSVFKSEFEIDLGGYTRVAPEIFGAIVEMEEVVSSVYQNSSGSQTMASKSAYIKKVTSTNSLSSNSGSVTLDWFGYSKTDKYKKEIGAIKIRAQGWTNMPNIMPQFATLFTGYTWEANENKSKNGYEINVSLVGVTKRLEDVNLIVPPIFDGYFFTEVADYICKAAGVSYDFTEANNPRLCMTTDINSVIYNLTTGTTCKNALDLVCKDCANRYFQDLDGKLIFYAVNRDGTPKYGKSKIFSFTGIEIDQNDVSPSFDNVRNYIVLIAMKKTKEMTGKDFPESWIPIPITSIKTHDTTPNIPWQKAICYTLPGYLEVEEVDLIADSLDRSTKKYELLGNVTVPGLQIQPLDKVSLGDNWGTQLYWVVSVNQNVDLEKKSWTTSLELMM